MADDKYVSGRRKRASRADFTQPKYGKRIRGGADRPTDAERAAAERRIEDMRAAAVKLPIISRTGRPPEPHIVACAMALERGEKFKNDAEACRLFGIHENYDVRGLWFGKFWRLALYEEEQSQRLAAPNTEQPSSAAPAAASCSSSTPRPPSPAPPSPSMSPSCPPLLPAPPSPPLQLPSPLPFKAAVNTATVQRVQYGVQLVKSAPRLTLEVWHALQDRQVWQQLRARRHAKACEDLRSCATMAKIGGKPGAFARLCRPTKCQWMELYPFLRAVECLLCERPPSYSNYVRVLLRSPDSDPECNGPVQRRIRSCQIAQH